MPPAPSPSEPTATPAEAPRQPPSSGLRIRRPGLEPCGPPIEILVDGRAVPALAGETVAAALTAAGQLSLRQHAQGGERGVYCGMGVCFDCRVSIDGRPGERACLVSVRPGMRVQTGVHADACDAACDTPPRAEPQVRLERVQVLVVGAGPAGLAAAEAAAESGLRVLVLDERPAPGGQYFKPVASSHRISGGAQSHRHPDRQFERGAMMVDRVHALGVRTISRCTVWDAEAGAQGGATLRALDADGQLQVDADALIVAAGAYERSWPVPGWTLPGVMSTGAAQTLARSYQVAPGRRILVAGNGPLNLQVAADLARSGMHVVAVAEAARAPWRAPPSALLVLARTRPDLLRDGLGYVAALRSRGVPVRYRHVLARVEGEGKAERAVLVRIADDGTPVAGSEVSHAVDAVCTGYGFAPSIELTRLLGCRHEPDARHALIPVRDADGRTTLSRIYVAGDAGGPWGAHAALAQGRIAGLAAVRDLGAARADQTAQVGEAKATLAHETDFQRSLWRMFAAPDCGDKLAGDSTIVCRCENVAFGAVRAEIARGAANLAEIKRSTRCGMGHCQGRYCSLTIAQMLAGAGGTPPDEATYFRVQAPLRPLPMDALARTQPDISAFATLDEPAADLPAEADVLVAEVDTLVIGAGIVGLCTARELARAGQAVAVLERNRPHAEASGTNAGSLHVQFQTFGFQDLGDAAAVRAPVSTLALQRDSVYLWDELANEFGTQAGADIEVAIDGGLTVADDAASLVHLRRKVALERGAGLAIEMLTGDEARSIAPYLSQDIVAASLSRDEGKINPLKAVPAVLAAALAAGAKVHANTRVVSIAGSAGSFSVCTDRGLFKAKRIVNAAGAWAGAIGALAGDPLPVRPNPIQMLVSEAMPPVIPYHLAHATRRLTLKQAANGNLIIGGGWRAHYDAGSKRMRPSLQGISGNLAVVLRLLPGLGPLLVIRSWTGTAFVTPPAIGESARVPGLFHAVAQNGMTLGPAIGRLCADLVLGRTPRRDPKPFSPARFLEAGTGRPAV